MLVVGPDNVSYLATTQHTTTATAHTQTDGGVISPETHSVWNYIAALVEILTN